jgi:predicted NUDIX family phosphoesterase
MTASGNKRHSNASRGVSTFLGAAEEVLRTQKKPMTALEIVAAAVGGGYMQTKGATPAKTMNARLSIDILQKKNKSRFLRLDTGLYGLRDWPNIQSEYIAPRRRIALFDEEILVFDRSLLRLYIPENGLTDSNIDHHSLMASCFGMRRREAETDLSVIQLVSIYVVRYRHRYFTYKRSKRLPESRLHHTYSACFGGHLNPDDLMPLFRFADPEQALNLIDRELNEELRLGVRPDKMQFIGLLYDPRSEVSKQHLGVVFSVFAANEIVEVGERGFLTDLRLETRTDIMNRIGDFENWSEFLMRSGRV